MSETKSEAVELEIDGLECEIERLMEENQKLVELFHEVLDNCYGERRDCGGIVEDMIVKGGVKINEAYNWKQRD